MARDRHERHVEGLGQVADRGDFAPGKAAEDRAAGGVGESGEGAVEGVFIEGKHAGLRSRWVFGAG